MPGVVRPYTIVDVLQTIYSAATGNNAGVSNTNPSSVISLVGEADEQMSLVDATTGVSEVNRGWGSGVWGEIGWQ
jgi:hypothetical protein